MPRETQDDVFDGTNFAEDPATPIRVAYGLVAQARDQLNRALTVPGVDQVREMLVEVLYLLDDIEDDL